jgi:hypothetical protein
MELANDTNWITKFDLQVTPSSNRIFANGRHQLEISVGVKLKDGHTLSDDQLDSLELVVLHDNGEYVSLNGGNYKVARKRDSRFEYYGDTGSAPGHLTPPPVTVHKRFYVSSTASGGTRQSVYALIKKDEKTYYVSATSRFNTYALIESITPLRKGQAEFSLERVHDQEFDAPTTDGSSNTLWVDFYYLTFKNVDFRVADVIQHGLSPFPRYFSDAVRLDNVGQGPLHPGSPQYESNIHFAFNSRVSEYTVVDTPIKIKHRKSAMTFMRVEVIGAKPYKWKNSGSPLWSVFDQYGNAYKIEALQINAGNAIDFKVRP